MSEGIKDEACDRHWSKD